jgi:hypothetical protein
MAMRQSILIACGAAMAVTVSCGAALAVQLQAVRDTAIYDQQLNQIGTMPYGAVYEGTCQEGYCYVDVPYGFDGWVVAGDLAYADGNSTNQQTFDQAYQLGLALGALITGQPVPQAPGTTTPQASQVCFYDRTNFRGEGFCAPVGYAIEELPEGWNDRISSISIPAGLSVEVCRNAEFAGSCQSFDEDVSRLPSRLNDRVTSLEVGG